LIKAEKKGRAPDALAPFFVFKAKAYFKVKAYFVTWPRISPPGLAAVWTLT
jgi:hypothetical protein